MNALVNLLGRLLREPLVHFLVAGGLLYGLYAWRGGDESPHHIVVDRAALLQYLQYQSKAFDAASFGQQLDAMTPAQRQRLIEDYVREEVLYREARALGLEQGDYVMRQRLVQKMRFLLERRSETGPTDAELEQYLRDNSSLYAVEPSLTFTQVFIDPSGRGDAAAARHAARLLRELNARHAQFNDSPRYSDRVPFLQNYVERTPGYVASHFGEQFMAELARLPVQPASWQGPLRSTLGWHLVMITARTPERMPQLEEIRPQLLDDWRREKSAALQDRAIREMVDGYQVEVRDTGARQP